VCRMTGRTRLPLDAVTTVAGQADFITHWPLPASPYVGSQSVVEAVAGQVKQSSRSANSADLSARSLIVSEGAQHPTRRACQA
jgi:hypothetical protein